MKKTYLLTPGPTAIAESVRTALSVPIIHHRTPAFEAIFQDVKLGLKKLFQTENDVLILTSTGTGAMDAAVSNLFSAGDSVITVNGGKFGERWTKISKTYGLLPIEIKLAPGQAVTVDQIKTALDQNPKARAVLFQASETSTGVRMPVKEIAELCHTRGVLSVVDAITACGVFDLRMDEWKIDVMMTGSQKALMLPPGLAFISLSPKAWKAAETSALPKFYFDLSREKKMLPKNQTAWTPAISLIQGLQESLRLIHEETLPKVFARHEILAKATRAGIEAMGLSILASTSPSTAVTAVVIPSDLKDGAKIPKLMRDKLGVTIVGGQDELDGKILRLSHFGYCDRFDILTVLSALELILNELGHPITFGKAAGAALQIFSQEKL